MEFINKYKRWILAIVGTGSIGLIVFSVVVLEWILYLSPCPLCMMQRVGFFVAGLFFILEAIFFNSSKKLLKGFIHLGKYLGIFFGIAMAARHLYIQSLPADKVPKCGFDFYGLINHEGFWGGIAKAMQGTGDCATVDKFLWWSIPTWSMIAFVSMLLIAVILGDRKIR